MQRVGFMQNFICKEPAVMCMNDHGLAWDQVHGYLYLSTFKYTFDST